MAGNDGAASIQACALRMARLATDGSTPAGATNMIVTNALIKMELAVVNETGDEFTVKNGCGLISYEYKDDDKLKRLDATLTVSNPDVEMAELLTNGSIITAGGQSIGFSAPAVGAPSDPGVSVEIWSKAWIGSGAPPGVTFTDAATTSASTTLTSASAGFTTADAGRTISGTGIPANTTILTVTNSTTVVLSAAATATGTGVTITLGRPGAYWRWVFPKYVATISDFTLENGAREVVYKGTIYENPGIGNGPLNDFPAGMNGGRLYSYYRDSAIPSTATIGYTATPAQV